MADVEDLLPRELKQMYFLIFGCYPILAWHEDWTRTHSDFGEEYEEPINFRDFTIFIDTEKLDQIDEWEYSYVRHLLINVINHRIYDLKHNSLGTIYLSTGKKYCFSDTESWWQAIRIENTAEQTGDRPFVNVEVEICS